jgi:hypothetical protein
LNLQVVGTPVADVMEGGAWEELDPMLADLQVSAASREGVEGALA